MIYKNSTKPTNCSFKNVDIYYKLSHGKWCTKTQPNQLTAPSKMWLVGSVGFFHTLTLTYITNSVIVSDVQKPNHTPKKISSFKNLVSRKCWIFSHTHVETYYKLGHIEEYRTKPLTKLSDHTSKNKLAKDNQPHYHRRTPTRHLKNHS